jgi:hypothetical protein
MPMAVTPLRSLDARCPGDPAPAPAAAGATARHGRRAGGLALPPEEAAWYAELLADHRRLYAPQDAVEDSLVEQLCLVELKLARLDRLELAALDAARDAAGGALPGLAALTRYRARITKERWELEHRLGQLAERRVAAGSDPATARRAVQDAARTRALQSLALLGLAHSARRPATNEPEPAARARSAHAREAGVRPRSSSGHSGHQDADALRRG